ncbi:sensor domain-containing protein [Pseudonocardia kongjuensis]|uniref:histidine kinase n=1 Tax=Pseudonocardia kongjuensis TaxID=102227 RepID=A0ABN1Y1N1_9PSEU
MLRNIGIGVRIGLAGIGRLVLAGFAAAPILLVLVVAGMLLLPVLGLGVPVLLGAHALVRRLAGAERRWAGRLLGVRIDEPPDADPAVAGPLLRRRFLRMLRSRTFRRQLGWLLWETVAAATVVLLLGAPLVIATRMIDSGAPLLLLPGYALLLAPLLMLHPICRALARVSGRLLGARPDELLAHRVAELARSRTETVEAQDQLIRRVERDLHDGTQAHVVATGMTIGLARSVLRADPDQADALLAEAEQTVAQTLQELRATVRGIRPPVLAERGLADAVRALCLRSRVPVEQHVDVPALAPTVETAVYFALAEALTNVNRHSGADRARLTLRHCDGAVHARLVDDGTGGAAPTPGSGLDGIRTRLGALDGRIGISSPGGGPTEIRMEVPCEPSSPRISPSSGTGSSVS